MEYVIPIITGISLSACTGFRAFLPPFLVGLFQRLFPHAVMIFPKLSFLSQTPVLFALGVAVVVEFLGDKIPWVDNLLDAIEFPIKAGISVLMTYFIIPTGDFSWVFLLFTLVIGSGATLTVHTAKAGVRATASFSTGGVLNPMISLAEEVVVLMGTLFAIFVPILAALFLGLIIWRCARFLFGPRGGNDGKFALSAPSIPFTRVVRVLFHFGFRLYNRMDVFGIENVPLEGPYVLVANHASMADGFILGCTSPLPTFIMVKKEAFENPLIGWFLRKSLAFPIDRHHPDPTSIKFALRVLQENRLLALFPEGTRNPQGLIRPFKPGAIKIALKQKVKIVPVYIADSHLISPPGTWFPRPVKLSIRYGEPIDPVPLLARGVREDEIQVMVFEAVCHLGKLSTGKEVTDLVEARSMGSSPQELSASA